MDADTDAPTRRVDEAPMLDGPPGEPPLSRGDFVGRYLVVEPIGEGGMGMVYRAYDPDLDRQVAIKVLRPAGPGFETSESGPRDRLLREAQAMARISHPNIVRVHDVGPFGDRVFLAMDLLDGENAKAWLRAAGGPRPWREVLGVFVLAGRGLAAAHSVGLVHRDFKPENVLIASNGDVLVTDFGLARLAGVPEPTPTPTPRRTPTATPTEDGAEDMTRSSTDRLLSRLTQTGATVGTPAYMAPEQHAGGDTDARSDQYSYCVALYEALYGERPHAGTTVGDVVSEKMRSRIRDAPRDANVPGWLRRVVVRGLRVESGKRWPSMQALLRELEHRPGVRRRGWIIAAGAAAVVATLGAGQAYVVSRREAACPAPEARLEGVWDRERKLAISREFQAAGVPYFDAAWETVQRVLDARATAWAAQQRQTCEATHVHGDQSVTLMNRHNACLDVELARIEALTEVFADADRDTVERAAAAVHEPNGLARCSDARSLPDRVSDARLDRQIAHAHALVITGRNGRALEQLPSIIASAEADSDRIALASALLVQADALAQSGATAETDTTLYRAVWAAEAGRADWLGAQAWVDILEHAATTNRPVDDARVLVGFAEHAARRAGDDPVTVASLWHAASRIEAAAGNRETALEHGVRALELRERSLGTRHPDVARSLALVAGLRVELGDADRAVTDLLRALAIAEDVFGTDHPKTGQFVIALAAGLAATGREDEARRHRERARRIELANQ